MSTDAELTFDDLIAFATDPGTQSPPATGPIITRSPSIGPNPIGPTAGRPAAGPVRASSHVNVELTRIERRRASLRSVERPGTAAPTTRREALRAPAATEPAATEPAVTMPPAAVPPVTAPAATVPIIPAPPAAVVMEPVALPVRQSASELTDPFALPPKPHSAPEPAKTVKVSKKGQFYRPELYSGWERFTGSLAVRVTGFGILGAGVVGVVVLAANRF